MARTSEVMQLSGVKELQRALRESSGAAIAEVEESIALSTFSMTRRMESRASEKTGRLKRAIKGTARGLNGRIVIDASAWYWRFIEFGTVNMGARPFVRPAVEEEAPEFEGRLRKVASNLERNFASGSLR